MGRVGGLRRGEKALLKSACFRSEVPRARGPRPIPSHSQVGRAEVFTSPSRSPGGCPSSSQRLNVLEHLLESLPGGRLGVLERDLDPAVEAEGFQLQPDKAKAVVVKQDEGPRRPLGAGEAVASDEPRAVEAGKSRGEGEGKYCSY